VDARTERPTGTGAGATDAVPGETAGAPAAPAAPARQRWRLVLARSADAPDLGGRELAEAWESAFVASGLPAFVPPGRARARVAFGAPVSAGLVAEAELADIVITELVPAWRVREALEGCLPTGWRLTDLFDVWLGAPALAGQVVAADYRIEVTGGGASEIAAAAGRVLASDRLPRERVKGSGTVVYDLRPLVEKIEVVAPGPPVVLRTRTRSHPELGTGRPTEVVAALSDASGCPLSAGSIVRERLVLAEAPRGE
jgi:radical SAM-linked protein